MVEALVGCIAGAALVSETERIAQEAGLADVRLKEKKDYMEAMTDWQDPLPTAWGVEDRYGAGSANGRQSEGVTAPSKGCAW
jgi:hypothetical protein